MIKSMTGYGSAGGSSGKLEITIELRSVNNRYLDCNIRIPRIYTVLEDGIKALIQNSISRGKVDVYVTIDASAADDTAIKLNVPVADAYMDALNNISEKYNIKNDVTSLSLARFPDVLIVERKETDVDALGSDIQRILGEAVKSFNAMRVIEGEKLKDDILCRLALIEKYVAAAEERAPQIVTEYRARLTQKMQDVLENTKLDESRILTEAAIFADRVAIDEELVRLRSHISQFRDILKNDEPVGRKLDFLVQELNREANTTGSKSNDVDMARVVVDIKSEIEKIREQIQNIE